jgi:hypothetical protein
MDSHGDYSATMIRKLSDVQVLIRKRYGPGFFARYAGWSKRHAVGTEWDKQKHKYVTIFSDGARA